LGKHEESDEVFGMQPGTFELYEDDGKNFDYEQGDFALRTFVFADGKASEKITKLGKPLFGAIERWVEMTNPGLIGTAEAQLQSH
jgi:hypothetical protein